MKNSTASGPARPRAKRWELTVRRGRELRRHAQLLAELDRQGPPSWRELPWFRAKKADGLFLLSRTAFSAKQVPAPTQASGADRAILSVDGRMLRLVVHYGLARSTVEYCHLPWPPDVAIEDFIGLMKLINRRKHEQDL